MSSHGQNSTTFLDSLAVWCSTSHAHNHFTIIFKMNAIYGIISIQFIFLPGLVQGTQPLHVTICHLVCYYCLSDRIMLDVAHAYGTDSRWCPIWEYHVSTCMWSCWKVTNVVSCCQFFRVADLLLAGAVMNRIFQPHESHIPYTLQVNTTLPMLLFNSN